MKIILTIKSFLNYLYNNLIDMVWTSKIKFADGTEMTTVPKSETFNLFDIKLMSEKIAQKNWSCISYPTQHKLNKTDVPTAYAFLKDKLDNVDGAMSGAPTGINTYTPAFYHNGYYYYQDGNQAYRSHNKGVR